MPETFMNLKVIGSPIAEPERAPASMQANAQGWNHNNHYHHWILSRLPVNIEFAIDIGCGAGAGSVALIEAIIKIT
jgi:hypothetical protein